MQLSQHHIPEVRLYPECITDIKTVYDAVGSEPASSLDVAKIMGYASNTTGAYYRRLESLEAYGLIERHGKIRVSELGKRVTYPERDIDKKLAMKEAVLHVALWQELFRKFGKNLPAENLWVQIKNITGVEAPLAQKVESVIRKWYVQDISQISDDVSNGQQSSNDATANAEQIAVQPAVTTTVLSDGAYGKLLATGVGSIDITDEDTLELARSALNIIEKKVKASRLKQSAPKKEVVAETKESEANDGQDTLSNF